MKLKKKLNKTQEPRPIGITLNENPLFQNWTKSDYERSGIKYIVPMTAKAIEDVETQDLLLSDEHYIVEEKFDGTRGVLHFFGGADVAFDKLYPKWFDDDFQYLCRSLVMLGSGFVGGRERIRNYFVQNKTGRADFLKKEFGTGGQAGCTHPVMSIRYDSSGYTIRAFSEDVESVHYTWSKVAEAIEWLLDAGLFSPTSFAHARVFSRRESKKTGWLTENTDSVPQLRDINIPELDGTILDGEMFIPNRPFKDVAAIMNCTYDKAIERQKELGFVVFHAFDILYYKGIRTERMPLEKRKYYLQKAIDAINKHFAWRYPEGYPFIKNVPYYSGNVPVSINKRLIDKISRNADIYPTLFGEINGAPCVVKTDAKGGSDVTVMLSHKAYYEYVVMSGGEGVMLKPLDGRYYHKRGREYQKIKKFLTRDVIITGFSEPTMEYTGKFPDDSWDYWVSALGNEKQDESLKVNSAKILKKGGYIPVTKYYYKGWVGNIEYGVIITDDEIANLPKLKDFDILDMVIGGKPVKVVSVGDCGGFDEDTRQYFTANRKELIGSVVEVLANEQFEDTGKLRHPRFLRLRTDKSAEQCTWKDHFA